ncbi:helix-turn-helix transcriptional regulator [Guyparkeria halophila]|uniref:Helix-turn-helix transcriptional regulator n=1 Tax=Guyparkeria halophila TaxID=47960 RepID=A0ABZ0YY72_9GAMM|nr:helix-turn-helix transcriptional regulator [Guyparkeria halophila]WQH17128.1 helix-turn-helix transcriptional regulator [Guyparkeria halophila]
MSLPDRVTSRIHQLWDELADFDAAQPDSSLDHLLTGLCELVNGQNAIWFAGVRMPQAGPNDPFSGWRPKGKHALRAFKNEREMERFVDKRVREGKVDLTTIRNVSFAGRLRANRLADLVPDDWFQGDFYQQMYRRFDLGDAIWAGCPVNVDAEVYIGVYRHLGEPCFTERDRDAVEAALRGLKWFHHRQLLNRGIIIADAPLTRTERRVLTELLTGGSEKEVADQLGHSPHTTHDYVKSIYRKFGVSNRAALMGLWLGASGGG